MTVKEYIDQNLPFYHLTKMENLDGILQDGLMLSRRPGARHGICVVRSKADDIISEIIDCQLQEDRLDQFALIKIQPQKHNISVNDISIDPTDDVIAPMCNYIIREPVEIGEEDIIRPDIPVGLWHETKTEIEKLTDYCAEVPPINR